MICAVCAHTLIPDLIGGHNCPGPPQKEEPPCPSCGARDEYDRNAGSIRAHSKACTLMPGRTEA